MNRPRRGDSRPLAPGPRPGPAGDGREFPALPEASPIAPTEAFLAMTRGQGIDFEPGDLDRLGRFLAMLLAANETMNLTAIKDPAEAWTRHVADSLTLLPALAQLSAGSRVIDVGSGGGLPGLPLAIVLPHLRFTLLDSTGKKAEFVRRAAAALGLSNVEVIADRAERLAHDRGARAVEGRAGGHREAYDAVIARAVGRLPTLLELTVPFAKVGAPLLLIKGEQADAEVAEAKGALHLLKASHVQTIATPTGRIVVIEKGAATPKLYPRADGEPKRVPLGVERR